MNERNEELPNVYCVCTVKRSQVMKRRKLTIKSKNYKDNYILTFLGLFEDVRAFGSDQNLQFG